MYQRQSRPGLVQRILQGEGVLDNISYQLPGGATKSTSTPVDLLPAISVREDGPGSPNDVPHQPVVLSAEQFSIIINTSWKRSKMSQLPFTVGTTPLFLRPENPDRQYLFIVNYDATNNFTIGFGRAPTGPLDGARLQAGGFYEPIAVPTNEIWVLGAAAGVAGFMMYG